MKLLIVGLGSMGKRRARLTKGIDAAIQIVGVDTAESRRDEALRLGLADAKDVEKTEQQLQQAIPKSDWSKAHHWLIFHGRRVCAARAPKCDVCTLAGLCKFHQSGGK